MADICYILSLIFGLFIVGLLVTSMIIALYLFDHSRPDSREEIHRLGAEACRKAQNLSDDFLRKVSDLLKES